MPDSDDPGGNPTPRLALLEVVDLERRFVLLVTKRDAQGSVSHDLWNQIGSSHDSFVWTVVLLFLRPAGMYSCVEILARPCGVFSKTFVQLILGCN